MSATAVAGRMASRKCFSISGLDGFNSFFFSLSLFSFTTLNKAQLALNACLRARRLSTGSTTPLSSSGGKNEASTLRKVAFGKGGRFRLNDDTNWFHSQSSPIIKEGL